MAHAARQRSLGRPGRLTAAGELLAESDLRALTVGAAMGRTGMQRSASYSYFDDRNTLVMHLLGRIEMVQSETGRNPPARRSA